MTDREYYVQANAAALVEALGGKVARQRAELARLNQRCAALTAERARLRDRAGALEDVYESAGRVVDDADPLEEAFDPGLYAVDPEELERLRASLAVAGGALRQLGYDVDSLDHGYVNDLRDACERAEAEAAELRRLLEAARAEADRLRGMVKGLCARVAAQSDLLSRRAGQVPPTPGPADVAVTEDDGDPE